MQGWMNVRKSYSHALEQGTLPYSLREGRYHSSTVFGSTFGNPWRFVHGENHAVKKQDVGGART